MRSRKNSTTTGTCIEDLLPGTAIDRLRKLFKQDLPPKINLTSKEQNAVIQQLPIVSQKKDNKREDESKSEPNVENKHAYNSIKKGNLFSRIALLEKKTQKDGGKKDYRNEMMAIDWNDFQFCNGCYKFKPTRYVSVVGYAYPITVQDGRSRQSFNMLKPYLQEKYRDYTFSINLFGYPVLDERIDFDEIFNFLQENDIDIVFPKYYDRNYGFTAEQVAVYNSRLKKKSEYVERLVKMQADDYKVVPTREYVCYESSANQLSIEDAFIFTIKRNWSDELLLVFENVTDLNRASIIFCVERRDYQAAVQFVFELMQKDETNKRLRLRYMDKTAFNMYKIKWVDNASHTTVDDWFSNVAAL